MPGDPKEFRENAQRCLAMAAEAPNPDLRETLVETAQRWLRLATTSRLLTVFRKLAPIGPPTEGDCGPKKAR